MDALAHEAVAHLDSDKILLGLLAAVLDGAEEFGINAQYFGEHAGIEFITLALVLVDGSQLAGVGNGDFHPLSRKEPADPRAVGSDFDGDLCLRVIDGEFLERFTGVGDGKLLDDVSVLVGDADLVFPITEVDAEIRSELLNCGF